MSESGFAKMMGRDKKRSTEWQLQLMTLDKKLDDFKEVLTEAKVLSGILTEDSLDQLSDADVLKFFEEAWSNAYVKSARITSGRRSYRQPVFDKPWQEYVGTLGDCVGHWLSFVKSTHLMHAETLQIKYLTRLGFIFLENAPHLLNVAFKEEPFTGETWLMQVIANGDEVMLEQMLKHTEAVHVNAVTKGTFLHQRTKCQFKPYKIDFGGVTVLEIATIAPRSDEVATRLVKRLLDAEADPNIAGRPSLWHRLACLRWSQNHHHHSSDKIETNGLVSPTRLKDIMMLLELCSVESPYFPTSLSFPAMATPRTESRLSLGPKISRRGTTTTVEDAATVTPLQLAAIVGNDEVVKHIIGQMVRTNWAWGLQAEVRIPLDGLDAGNCEDTTASVLELLLVYKHRDMLRMKLFHDLTVRKWKRFGRFFVRVKLGIMSTLAVLLTIGCLPETLPLLQRVFRLLVLVISAVIVTGYVLIWRKLKTQEFVSRLQVFGTEKELGLDETNFWYFPAVSLFSLIVVLLHDIELLIEEKHWNPMVKHARMVLLDTLASFLVWVVWLCMCSLLRLFQRTSTLTVSLYAIFKHDLAGWATVYVGLCLATAGGIRIATWHFAQKGDEIKGTFMRTLMTLEEATHGPDVQWRTIVMKGDSVMAAFFFIFFLWAVTIIMFNLLIAMFSSTFDERKEQSAITLFYDRAVEVVFLEKALPPSLYSWFGCSGGISFGDLEIGMYGDKGAANEVTPLVQHSRWMTLVQSDMIMWHTKVYPKTHH